MNFPLPAWIRWSIFLLTLLIAISAGAGILLALTPPKTAWFLLIFETLVLCSIPFGILITFKRFSEAPALALLCVAGTIFLSSILGYLSARTAITAFDMRLFLQLRLLAALLLSALAALSVLIRRPRLSIPLLLRALIFSSLFLASAAALWFFRSRILTASEGLQLLVAVVGGIWLLAMLAPAIHFSIKAFDTGRMPDQLELTK